MEKSCCEWRKMAETAIEKGDISLLEEIMYNWIRFSEREPNTMLFKCLSCRQKMVEWGKMNQIDFTQKDYIIERVQNQVKSGEVKCCGIVKLIDLNDPEKSVLTQQAWSIKEVFKEQLCFACLVKINEILTSVRP